MSETALWIFNRCCVARFWHRKQLLNLWHASVTQYQKKTRCTQQQNTQQKFILIRFNTKRITFTTKQ